MSGQWDEYYRRVGLWETAGDSERLALASLHAEGFRHQEADPERSFATFTRGRDEARRLNEPWWVLFYESWRLSALTSYVKDFGRALPVAMELMARFNSPEGRVHVDRPTVLGNVLYTYTNLDPLTYQAEIERGFAHMDGEIAKGPVSERFVLNHRWMSYFAATERWDEAHDLALGSLGLVARCRESHLRIWHGAWALFEICRICHALGRLDDLAGHAEHMGDLSEKNDQLRRTRADAWLWRAVTRRANGDEKGASRSFHRGIKLLGDVERRDSICAEPTAAYYEAGGDWEAALGVRDRELAEVTKKGMRHRVCQIQVERCRLLASADELTPADMNAARLSASQLGVPGWYLEKLDRIANTGPMGT